MYEQEATTFIPDIIEDFAYLIHELIKVIKRKDLI